MSKFIKQLEFDALKQTFGEIRDLVLLNITGVSALTENQMRLALRKKNIRLQMVKNSHAARFFTGVGIRGLDSHLEGPTTIAYGSSSIADLSKEIDSWVRRNDKIKPKAAVADGAVVDFEAAKRFPTRTEAIGRVVALILSPGARLAAQLHAAGGRLAGQLKALKEEGQPSGEPAPASGS